MSGPRPQAVADFIAATRRAGEPPAMPAPPPTPGPATVRRFAPTREQFADFGVRVAALHTIRKHGWGELAMCSCGLPAVMCSYIALAHQFLGMPVPWDPANPPEPFVSA